MREHGAMSENNDRGGKGRIALKRRGLGMIISSPSGAGKTTLSRMLLQSEPQMEMSVSVTTRPPRPGEVNGRDYWFVSREEFEEMRASGGLLEWAEVFGNFYGTPREKVESAFEAGKDVLFDVDWQGAQQIVEALRCDVVTIFLLPPSGRELYERLKRRAQDPEEVINRRMAGAAGEIAHWAEYQYVVINDVLEEALADIRAILRAEHLKRERRQGLSAFARGLIDELHRLCAQKCAD